jgi:maltose O-acetyltransferase
MNHDYEGTQLPYDAGRILKPVHIGRCAWIGMNVTIVPGVTVGDGAIVGMGTVVAQDVPPLAVVGSAPQRVLKTREEDHYKKLDKLGRYGGTAGYPWKRGRGSSQR